MPKLKPALLNLNRLRVFVAVAEHLSFSRAAHSLALSQPAVSSHIKQLELQVGESLFEQRTRNLSLTATGQRLHEAAQRLLASAEEMQALVLSAKGAVTGRVVLAVDGIWEQFVPELLADFLIAHPGVLLSVRSANFSSRSVQELLLEGQVTLGFVAQRPRDARFEETLIAEELTSLSVITPKGHPLSEQPTVEPRELEHYPMVYHPPLQSGPAFPYFERLGIRPTLVFETSSLEGIKRAVARGAGISLLSANSLRGEPLLDRFAVIPLAVPPLKRNLFAIRRKGRAPSPTERALLAYFTANFGLAR